MKNATSYLIVNLAISELLSTSVILIITWASRVIAPDKIPYYNEWFAVIFCKTIIFLDSFCHDLAIMSLTVIALDRFLGVKYPLRKIITRDRAKKIIGVIWLLAFIATCINLYSARPQNNNGNIRCVDIYPHFPQNSKVIFTIIQMVLFFVAPLCIMGVLYSITVYKLWIRRIPGNVTAANQRLEHQTKVKVLKMCITVVVVFALCWFPLYVMRIIELTSTFIHVCPPSQNITIALVCLSFTSYAINPLIYFIFSRDFRNGFLDIIKPLGVFCHGLFHKPRTSDVTLSNTAITYDNNVQILSIRNLGARTGI